MQPARRLLWLAIVTFAVLAMPLAATGVAWPSMSEDLAMPVGQLGLFIAIAVVGYFVSTVSSGQVAARVGPDLMLRGAATLAVVVIAGHAVAPNRAVLLGFHLLLGFAAGYVDAGVNTHVALSHGARAMGMLHAGYGVGATAGPLLITLLLTAGASWRWGFAVLAAAQLVVAAALATRGDGWASSPPRADPSSPSRRLPPAAWWTLALFVLYTGLEVGAGQWAFTLFTEGRGIEDGAAGLAVTGFYAALTVARLLLGGFGHRLPGARLSTVSGICALLAVTAVWLAPVTWVGPVALVACGFALGPIFPVQMTLTPHRTGAEGTASMVGYQIGAAAVGASLVPGLIGALVGPFGVPVAAPVLVVTATAMVGVDLKLRAMAAGAPASTDA